MLDAVEFDRRMRAARAVVTGEGKLDEQSLAGKLVSEIATRARQSGVPCYAIVGTRELDSFGARVLDLQVVLEAGHAGAATGGRAARLAEAALSSRDQLWANALMLALARQRRVQRLEELRLLAQIVEQQVGHLVRHAGADHDPQHAQILRGSRGTCRRAPASRSGAADRRRRTRCSCSTSGVQREREHR